MITSIDIEDSYFITDEAYEECFDPMDFNLNWEEKFDEE